MREARREVSQGGEVFRALQGVAVLVQSPFDPSKGGHGILELYSHGWRPLCGRFERRDALAQNGETLTEEGIGCLRVIHGCLPEDDHSPSRILGAVDRPVVPRLLEDAPASVSATC